MKRLATTLAIILITTLSWGQFVSNAAQLSTFGFAISGKITPISISGLTADGYITPIAGNITVEQPQMPISDLRVAIYPNPVQSILTVRLSANQPLDELGLELIGLDGRSVLKIEKIQTYGTNAYSRLNLSQLANGIYILKITYNQRTASFKIIKTH